MKIESVTKTNLTLTNEDIKAISACFSVLEDLTNVVDEKYEGCVKSIGYDDNGCIISEIDYEDIESVKNILERLLEFDEWEILED